MSTTILPLPGNRHVTSLAWDPTGQRIAATCSDGSLWVWLVSSQQLLLSRAFKGTSLLAVTWDPSGKKLALGSSSGLSVLQAWNGQVLLTHPFRQAVTKVSWSPLGSRFFAVSGKEVTVCCESGKKRVQVHPARVIDAAWRWDGVCIGSVCANGVVTAWDTYSQRRLYQLVDVCDPQSLTWHQQDRSLAIGTSNGIVQLHDPDTGAIQHREILSPHALCTLAWGKPGIVAATNKETVVWDGFLHGKVATMETATAQRGSTSRVPALDFDPAGEKLATGCQGMVYISSLG